MKRIIGLLLVVVTLLSILAVGASAASRYSDVDGHWGQTYVDYYSEKGVVNGYPDGTFRPDARITRAEAAQVLLNYFKFTGRGKGFIDVAENAWYYDAVLASQQNGAFQGYEDGSFKPASNITREEVIVMLRRITTADEDLESGKHFLDYYDVCDWAKGSVGALRNVGVLDGYEEIPGSFFVRVHRLITRAEFVKLLFTIERSNKVDWDIPGEPVEEDDPVIIPPAGGSGGGSLNTYYNVAVSITGPDVNNNDTIKTVGPKNRYSDTAASTSIGTPPLLADVYQVLVSGENISEQNWNYTSAFQTVFGNNLARCILQDMVKAYLGQSSVKNWSYYVNAITASDANWKNIFANDPAIGYETAVGSNFIDAESISGYTVITSFTTPTDPAEIAAYANAYNAGQTNGFYGGKTYTVTLTIYSVEK